MRQLLSRLFSLPTQYAPCIAAFRRSGKKGLVTTFIDDSDSSDPGDPNVGFDPEEDYEVISLRGLNELKCALDELDLKVGGGGCDCWTTKPGGGGKSLQT